MFGKKCCVSTLFYPINPDDSRLQDSSYIGNIAASNAVWVKTFGNRRKKGNIKKATSLRNIALINYNEGSNDEDEEEDLEYEKDAAYQYNTNIPTFSSYAKKSSTIPKRHSSLEPSPSSLRKPKSKRPIKSEGVAQAQKKTKILDLDESESNNSILDVK
jgi:hypothetical protein